MKVKVKAFYDFEYSAEEIAALEQTEKILAELYSRMGVEKLALISTSTGELLEMNEIPRVRSIISALIDSRVWDVN